MSSPYPSVKWHNEKLVLIYETGKGYRVLDFTKENAIKFFNCVKREYTNKGKYCQLKGVGICCDKIDIKEETQYIEPWFEMFKLELMYITGKKERPEEKKFNLEEYQAAQDQKKIDKKVNSGKGHISEEDKKKARKRAKK
jgi:hypothetical protein